MDPQLSYISEVEASMQGSCVLESQASIMRYIAGLNSRYFVKVTLTDSLTWSNHASTTDVKTLHSLEFLLRNFKHCSRVKASTFS